MQGKTSFYSLPAARVYSCRFLVIALVSIIDSFLPPKQDVIFKLNYFEKQQRFMTIGQIIEEMTRHYTKQAIKQM